MAFKDNTLEFFDNKIIDTTNPFKVEVMMDWEAPIMEKSAEYVCHNKGDVLEIGFGMGICADYIQAQGVNSHTIVEIHPQIFEKLEVWADDKPNVVIIKGDWATVSGLTTYDGIFIDTFGDDNWNNFDSENNEHSFGSISFDSISISPENNSYMNGNTYYMPKVEL